jgi:hypothetical protein
MLYVNKAVGVLCGGRDKAARLPALSGSVTQTLLFPNHIFLDSVARKLGIYAMLFVIVLVFSSVSIYNMLTSCYATFKVAV